MSIIQPFSSVSPYIYSSPLASYVGAYEHGALRIAEYFGLKLLQTCNAAHLLFGAVSVQEQFRNALENPPPVSAKTAFLLDIEPEIGFIKLLEKAGIIDDQKTLIKTAKIIAKIACTLLLITITSPFSLTLALTALLARCFVQNRMNDLTRLDSQTAAVWDGASPLSLFTCNVALTEFDIMDYINGVSNTHKRAPECADFLSETSADVICLQEAFDVDTIYPSIAKTLQEKGYFVVMTSKRQEVFGMTSGLLLASKFPIVDVGFTEYTNRAGIDARAKKGVLAATLKLNDEKTICVATTHMQAGYPGASQAAKAEGRVIQFHHARKFIKELTDQKPVQDVFLLGDFNIGRFGGLQCNQAAFKQDYQGEIKGLLEPSEFDSGFKDLTVPDQSYSFSDCLAHQSNFDTKSDASQETGTSRGSSLDTTATSYVHLKTLLAIDPEPSTVLQRAWRKPNVCDHVAFMKKETTIFKETGYDYQISYPVGPSGFLSDHVALQVSLLPRAT